MNFPWFIFPLNWVQFGVQCVFLVSSYNLRTRYCYLSILLNANHTAVAGSGITYLAPSTILVSEHGLCFLPLLRNALYQGLLQGQRYVLFLWIFAHSFSKVHWKVLPLVSFPSPLRPQGATQGLLPYRICFMLSQNCLLSTGVFLALYWRALGRILSILAPSFLICVFGE